MSKSPRRNASLALTGSAVALAALAGCTGVLQNLPVTGLGSPSPAASSEVSPTPTASESPTPSPAPTASTTGNLLSLTFSAESGTNLFQGNRPTPNSFTVPIKLSNFLMLNVYNTGTRTDAFTFSTSGSNLTPTVGKIYQLGSEASGTYATFSEVDSVNGSFVRHAWITSGGTLEVTAVSGSLVTFALHDATMVVQTKSGYSATGTFTLNGTLRMTI